VKALAGLGIVGDVGGERVAIGSEALFAREDFALPLSERLAGRLRASERTTMLVARGDAIVGLIAVEDQPRAGTAAALSDLRAAGEGPKTAMLTGDNARVATRVARAVPGIDEVHAGLLPADKMREIGRLQAAHGVVAMVGDGINDAPALARADVGIAMGAGGTAQAMESADVVLMQDDLRELPRALAIARRSRRLVKQNIALSLGLKLAFLALTIPGWATLWLAVAADVGATLLVTMNGMRMLRA
jgi:Cd2+/Zn2+-exporting ATPase